jgi:predicted dehydrogenase
MTGKTGPSDTIAAALIGCGGRKDTGFVVAGDHEIIARCDVDRNHLGAEPNNSTHYTDFRYIMDRQDIDAVCIATPPHWHALISIAAAQSGKHVFCEKPMTRFIAEGRAVVNAVERYGVVFQIGTFSRYHSFEWDAGMHKLMSSGLLGNIDAVFSHRLDSWKVKEWTGMVDYQQHSIPPELDYDMWLGPAPWKPYNVHRTHGSFRGYWDYDGGGLTDQGPHLLDGVQWRFARDYTSPVEVESHAPPAHHDACGMWAWVRLKYADGFTFVFNSREWGTPLELGDRVPSISDLSSEDQDKLNAMPDPEPFLSFGEAIRQGGQSGGNAEASHRCATLLHLANISIRMGRKINYDPVNEQIIGNEIANRLVNQPMRAPWHL